MESNNKTVANAVVARNKPYDIPMGAGPSDRVDVSMDEFTHQYGQREMPRPLHTTFDKLPSYLARWGILDQEPRIRRSLRSGREYRTTINVILPVVFSA